MKLKSISLKIMSHEKLCSLSWQACFS